MAWTTPKTWNVDELLTAANLNTHLRDNLNALKSPPTGHYECNEASDYTTTSTSFVDVDGTNLALTFTTSGGDVLVHFHASVMHMASGRIYFDVAVDGNRVAGDDGIVGGYVANSPSGYPMAQMTFTRLLIGLSAGEHTVKSQWKTSASTAKLYAGAGTTSGDVHPQFWAREVS
jgi:hypothetical protein